MESMRARGFITLRTKGVSMKASSLTIKCMGMEKRHGLMDESTKETIAIQRKTGSEPSYGPTVICTREIGETTSKTVTESTLTSKKALREEVNGKKENAFNGQETLR